MRSVVVRWRAGATPSVAASDLVRSQARRLDNRGQIFDNPAVSTGVLETSFGGFERVASRKLLALRRVHQERRENEVRQFRSL